MAEMARNKDISGAQELRETISKKVPLGDEALVERLVAEAGLPSGRYDADLIGIKNPAYNELLFSIRIFDNRASHSSSPGHHCTFEYKREDSSVTLLNTTGTGFVNIAVEMNADDISRIAASAEALSKKLR